MITEDFCSYELSKLLKEKGFNAMCEHYFSEKLDGSISCHTAVGHWNAIMNFIARPSLSLAMKWLREVHNIHIAVDRGIEHYFAVLTKLKPYQDLTMKNDVFDTYEEAVEAAIKYSLENLI